MTVRGCTISGFGSYVPDRILSNADLEKIVDTTDEWIVVHTGIRERRVIEDGKATSDMAVEAARKALDDAGVDAADLQLIIAATITADTIFPSMSAVLEDKLGANRAATFDLITGCTGFVDAIVTGSQYIQSGSMDRVLVVAGDALTRITNWSDRSTCVLFGDAATAAVLQPSEPDRGLLGWAMSTQGSAGAYLTIPSSGSAWPPDEKAIAEHATKLYMNGHEVFKLAVRGVPEVAEQALGQAGLTAADVDWVFMHQANQRILDAAADRLGIPHDRVISVLHKYGNTSAASMGLALDEIYQDGRLKKDDIVLLVGFGAGFCLAGAVLRWDK